MTNYETIDRLDSVVTDSDLMTYLELQNLGYTTVDRVSPTRENLLKDYDIQQLRFEIGRDYKISPFDVLLAEQLCIAAIYLNSERFLYGQA